MTEPDTSAEGVGRIRAYVEYPYTTRNTVMLDSALVRITAGDVADLLAERDALKARINGLQIAHNAMSMETAAHKARAEAAEAEKRAAYVAGTNSGYAAGLEAALSQVQKGSDNARKRIRTCDSEGHPEDAQVWSAIASHLDIAYDAIIDLKPEGKK